MTRIISIEPFRKESSQIKVELPSGDVYVIGFIDLQPVKYVEIYTKAIEGALNELEGSEDVDLNNYLSYKLACEKLETPLYVTLDQNRERERIGNRIRDIRTSMNMEAKRLARLSQIDAANLSRIEQGKYSVGLDILCKIAMALNSRLDIIPNYFTQDKMGQLSFTRKVWIIPTGDIKFNPLDAVPGCGFCLWPSSFNSPIHIGDLVVFYLNREKCYSNPFLVSGEAISMESIGYAAEFSDSWPKSETNQYLRAEYHNHLSDADLIHIKETIDSKFKTPPTETVEVQF